MKDYISPQKNIHMLGIGGSGMSAIARVLLTQGYHVSGTDLKETAITLRLKDMGAKIYFEHDAANLRGVHVLVVSTAISKTNPEYAAALENQITIFHRSEMLEYIMKPFKKRVCVSGTHGKTTTSSLVTSILDAAKLNPSFIIGAELHDYGTNAGLTEGDYFVAEADESDGSFLNLNPNLAILSNLEPEHMSFFKTKENLESHFVEFIKSVLLNEGKVFINKDDAALVSIVDSMNSDSIYYFSLHEPSKVMAKHIKHTSSGVSFTLVVDGQELNEIRLQQHGVHNVYNALSAAALALEEGINLDAISKGLWQCQGTKRRLQKIGEVDDVLVYDDYAHHPTEISTTLEGIKKSFECRLVCIFQPHRYSRTHDLLELFPESFKYADEIIITEIYSSNEEKIEGVSGQLIVDKCRQNNIAQAEYIAQKSQVAPLLVSRLRQGDFVITMGAGDIHLVSKEIVTRLKNRPRKESPASK